MANDVKNYTLPSPGNASRLQRELNAVAALSGSSTNIVYVTVRGTVATVVRDAALTIQAEIDAEQTAVDAHAGDPGNYEAVFRCEDPATNGRKTRDKWYENDDGNGNYSGLAKESVYNYTGTKKTTVVTTTFDKDGFVKSVETESYHTHSDGRSITKHDEDHG